MRSFGHYEAMGKALLNIAQEMEERLPRETIDLLRAAGRLASARGCNSYLVGGAVRDLLLGRPNLDLDVVVVGDAIILARQLARAAGVKALTHPRFGTAKLKQGGFSLDLAMARAETYAYPGALPEVRPGTIEEDLFRRDFSINAIATHIAPAHFGEVVDPYRGKDDLDQGLIRVLHPKSFNDDPTRILRALRYEQRLDFHLGQTTEELLRQNVAAMDAVSGDRLRHELELILKEEQPERVLSRAEELGGLRSLHPALRGNGWLAQSFQRARQASGDSAPEIGLYLALLTYHLSAEDAESFISRLRMGGGTGRVIRDMACLKLILPALTAPGLAPSGIYRLLERRSPQAILAAALASNSEIVTQRLKLYLSSLMHVRTALSGDDLKMMGVSPGKAVGQVLRRILEARLDQRVKDEEEERRLVREWLRGSK